ncbi:hypothetical protein H1C71_042007 [Ictidomys tridecemlineatus]|nr:hypothetical protein H1C71_042007 [Ictidomys tridecemlineatus]
MVFPRSTHVIGKSCVSHRREDSCLPVFKNLGVVPEALPHVFSLEKKSHNVLGIAENSREEQIFITHHIIHNEIVLSSSKMVHVAVCMRLKMMSNTDSCPGKVILMIVIWIGQDNR